METQKNETLSAEAQARLAYVVEGKTVGGSAMKARLDSSAPDVRTEIIGTGEFRQAVVDYVTGKGEERKCDIRMMVARISSTAPDEIKSEILANPEVIQSMADYVSGKGEERRCDIGMINARLNGVPDQIKSEITSHPEVVQAMVDYVSAKGETPPAKFAIEARFSKVPEEVKAKVAQHADVQKVHPNLA